MGSGSECSYEIGTVSTSKFKFLIRSFVFLRAGILSAAPLFVRKSHVERGLRADTSRSRSLISKMRRVTPSPAAVLLASYTMGGTILLVLPVFFPDK